MKSISFILTALFLIRQSNAQNTHFALPVNKNSFTNSMAMLSGNYKPHLRRNYLSDSSIKGLQDKQSNLFVNSFPLVSSGDGGAQLTLSNPTGMVYVNYFSGEVGNSTVYNYESGKNVYWGGSPDAGNYIFRGRNLFVQEGILGIGSLRGVFDVGKDGDIYLSSVPNGGSSQVVYLSGNVLMAPFSNQNVSYIQARRQNNSGITELQLRTSNNGAFVDGIRINSAGNVGIGTTTPNALLELKKGVAGGLGPVLRLTGGGGLNAQVAIDMATFDNGIADNKTSRIVATDDGIYSSSLDLQTRQPGASTNPLVSRLFIASNGNVGIGVTDTKGYLFAVNGNAIFAKVKVKDPAFWPDFVFHKSYSLPSLHDVEKFIQQYQHLPDVPSAPDVQKNGLDLGDNQSLLLKKIEELTLYLIEQNKKLEQQQQEINELKKRKN